jgi:nitrate/nitrite transporter NarK
MTTKEETEYELKVFENLNKEWLGRAEEHRRRIDLTKGIALGLLYGIMGNLFVQFFYPVVESLILQKYEGFIENVAITSVAFVIILWITIRFRGQLVEYKKEEETAKKQVEATRKAIQTRKTKLEDPSPD